MKILALILPLILTSCSFPDMQELRKENIDRMKRSCASTGGVLTIEYGVSTFTSSLSIKCTYPSHIDPSIDLKVDE